MSTVISIIMTLVMAMAPVVSVPSIDVSSANSIVYVADTVVTAVFETDSPDVFEVDLVDTENNVFSILSYDRYDIGTTVFVLIDSCGDNDVTNDIIIDIIDSID